MKKIYLPILFVILLFYGCTNPASNTPQQNSEIYDSTTLILKSNDNIYGTIEMGSAINGNFRIMMTIESNGLGNQCGGEVTVQNGRASFKFNNGRSFDANEGTIKLTLYIDANNNYVIDANELLCSMSQYKYKKMVDGIAVVDKFNNWLKMGMYPVSFDANGGNGSMDPQYITVFSSTRLNWNNFTKDGSKFDGWATSPLGSVIYKDGDFFTMVSENSTLYAIWVLDTIPEYTVTFDANGGTGTMSAQSIASGSSANLRLNTFTNDGYTFAGWATTPSGSVAYSDGASYTMGSANVTLYAKWTAVPTYSITFDANGGTGTMSTQSIASGASANLRSNTFSNAGFTFAGWATTPSGSVAYSDGASYTMGSANVTLYAKWTAVPTYSITFDVNGGTGTMSAQSIASGSSANLRLNTFTKDGYTFAGWATTPSGSVAYSDGANYTMGSADVTLYAKWTAVPTYSIIFDANGGTGTMSTQSIASGVTAVLRSNTFTTDGYTFAGWATTPSGSVVYSDGASYTMGTANVTLYAKWNLNASYTISFDANTGSGSMSAQSVVSGTSTTLQANSFSKTGYAFAGWATTPSGSIAYIDGASYTMGSANVTLYAKWLLSSVPSSWDGLYAKQDSPTVQAISIHDGGIYWSDGINAETLSYPYLANQNYSYSFSSTECWSKYIATGNYTQFYIQVGGGSFRYDYYDINGTLLSSTVYIPYTP